MDIDDLQWEQDLEARAELRRIISDGVPPSATPLEAFGPWAEVLGPLRRAYDERRPKAARQMVLSLVRRHAPLAALVARGPERHRAYVSCELAELVRAGKLVPGPRDGQVVPYLLADRLPPPQRRRK